MAGNWTSRQGLNVKGTSSLTIGHADVNQNIDCRVAIARVLAEALGGEGILSGGASVIGDITSGTTYPAVTIILADDSGEFFYFQLTGTTAIDFTSAGATSKLYAVIKLNTTDYASGYPAYGGYADVQLKAIDNGSAAPAHSLWLGTGSVTGSAFTTYTPNATATSSGGLINFTLAGDTGTDQTIGRSDTLTVAGGSGIATSAGATDTLTVAVVPGEISHTGLADIGTNSHATIDSHIADATIHFTAGSIDHGSIGGLADDDHTQYLLADGTRAASASLTLTGLTASRLVATDGSKVLASASLASWIAGTSNQVTVTDDLDGSITLSLPQSIATTSSPTFANITDSGLTITRVPFASTGGLLIDSASMAFDTTNGLKLAAGSASALNLTSVAGTAVGGLLLGTDTNLYRSGAHLLKTDDAFMATGDIYTEALTDYSATSTVVGWELVSPAMTTKLIKYKKVGKTVTCWYLFDGTSNSTTTTFTLPFTNGLGLTAQYAQAYTANNGTSEGVGIAYIPNGSATVNLRRNPGSALFTGSGQKTVYGMIIYEASS